MTVRDVESILLLLSFMILALPVSVVLAVVLVSRINWKHFMKWMHLYGSREWHIRIAWRDRKIERLTEERDVAQDSLARYKIVLNSLKTE